MLNYLVPNLLQKEARCRVRRYREEGWRRGGDGGQGDEPPPRSHCPRAPHGQGCDTMDKCHRILWHYTRYTNNYPPPHTHTKTRKHFCPCFFNVWRLL